MTEGRGDPYISYQDFEIKIRPGKGGDYPVAVIRSPAGEAESTLRVPFTAPELETRLVMLENLLLRDLGTHRLALSEDEQEVEGFGQNLFNALMAGDIRVVYEESRDRAELNNQGLRLKLRIQAPELAVLPWEYLYDPVQAQYLSLSNLTPLIRYISLRRPPPPLQVNLPLRILAMVASPKDVVQLNTSLEKRWMEDALQPLKERGLFELHWLENGTCECLQDTLRRGPWHVFHFIGHGCFDAQLDEGQLVMETAAGCSDYVSARTLGMLLQDYKSIRLVLLNACKGARGGTSDVFSRTSSILIRSGIPAVLAMQHSITNQAAIQFSRSFYRVLAEGWPVDAAVAEARKALSIAIRSSFAWGIPVLHTSAPDGVLFHVTAVSSAPAVIDEPTITAGRPIEKTSPTRTSEELNVNLIAAPNPSEVGGEVHWVVRVKNPGAGAITSLYLIHKGVLLGEDSFDLAPGDEQTFSFVNTYPSAGEYTETIRLVGSGNDISQIGSVQITGKPGVNLTLTPNLESGAPGTEVQWEVRYQNDGSVPLEQVMIFHGRKLLEGPHTLDVDEWRRADFKQIYQKEGKHSEKVRLTAYPAASQVPARMAERLERTARSSIEINAPKFNFLLIEKPLRLELVCIPAGSFLMGSDKKKDDEAYSDELPQYSLALDEYWIGKYPVTNRQYQVFLLVTGHKAPSGWQGSQFPKDKDDHPVVNVTWHDATAFCKWLSQETGKHYRLPSEAEWEKAARGTEGRIYPWGNEWDASLCNTLEGGKGTTTPVGAYSPGGDSPYGCVDMAGNVWEWTSSLWGKDHNKPEFKYPYNPKDGRENQDASNDLLRGMRGGSFPMCRRYTRCACRGGDRPGVGWYSHGFRVAVGGSPL